MRLTANGKTVTEKFEVQKDPRLDNVTIADLAEQFTLAMQVRDEITEANEMVIVDPRIEEADGRPAEEESGSGAEDRRSTRSARS